MPKFGMTSDRKPGVWMIGQWSSVCEWNARPGCVCTCTRTPTPSAARRCQSDVSQGSTTVNPAPEAVCDVCTTCEIRSEDLQGLIQTTWHSRLPSPQLRRSWNVRPRSSFEIRYTIRLHQRLGEAGA